MKKYVVCGVSNRALKMFIGPIVGRFKRESQIVGLLDSDSLRFEICKGQFSQLQAVPTYGPDEFDQMIAETHPDVVIVAGPDHTHANYIVKALEKGH